NNNDPCSTIIPPHEPKSTSHIIGFKEASESIWGITSTGMGTNGSVVLKSHQRKPLSSVSFPFLGEPPAVPQADGHVEHHEDCDHDGRREQPEVCQHQHD